MKGKVAKVLLCYCLVVGLLTGCGDEQTAYGSGGSRSITVNLANKSMKLKNVRFYDYMSNVQKAGFNGNYYAVSGLNMGSNELTFAGSGKTYVAKVNISSSKFLVRYTKGGSTDTYTKM